MSADSTRSGHFVLLGESNSGALGGKLGEIHTFSAKKTVTRSTFLMNAVPPGVYRGKYAIFDLSVESFPITGRTVCRDGMIPKTGFWCKLGAGVSF